MTPEADTIPICWVSREDLITCRPDLADRLAAMHEAEWAGLANQIGDALQETYWLAIAVALDSLVQSEPDAIKDLPNDAVA